MQDGPAGPVAEKAVGAVSTEGVERLDHDEVLVLDGHEERRLAGLILVVDVARKGLACLLAAAFIASNRSLSVALYCASLVLVTLKRASLCAPISPTWSAMRTLHLPSLCNLSEAAIVILSGSLEVRSPGTPRGS